MNLEELETISYEEAVKILGVSKNTLFGATGRGVLTPLPRRARKPGQLAKKQVELFVGKDLSLRWLSPEEAVLWQEIKQTVTAKKTPDSVKAGFAFELIEDKIEFSGALLEGAADIALEVVEGMLQAARAENLTPDKFVEWLPEYVKQSPSFKRIISLLGINMDDMPDETVRAMNAKAYEVAEKIQAKVFALMLRLASQNIMGIEQQETEQQVSIEQGDSEQHAQAS